jgi:NRPS condensation-like uncharacterized protein
MTFPLPVAAFEEYMLADDRPAFPMNFFIRMRFSGQLCKQSIEKALELVAERHPLLTARVHRKGHRWKRWEQPSNRGIPIRTHTITTPDETPQCPGIDLNSEGGLIGHVLHCGPTDQMLWQFHHACCDGLAGFQILEDWLIEYARLAGDPVPDGALRRLEEIRLKRRGHFGLNAWQLVKKMRRQAIGLHGARQFLMRKPVPILPNTIDGIEDDLPDRYPAAITRMFSREQTQSLRRVATQSSCTVNELLARDLFLALGQFRERHSVGNAQDWLRMSVPINLRRAGDRKLPAANVMSMVFLDRRQSDFRDSQRLLQSIHDEMQQIKTNELGLTFLLSLWLCRPLPGGYSKRSDRFECTATCVFTNLGNLFSRISVPRDDQSRLVVGGLVLESIDSIAPIRPFTGAAFAPFKYAKCLGTTMQFDPRMLSTGQARELLDDYASRVEATARL